MIGIFLIPTGIGAKIGGHAGDATPAAKLIAACCDKLILHPNVVNAADINEMPSNSLYVEGSILDGFLDAQYKLREVRKNKILVVANSPLSPLTLNAVSASRSTIGLDAEVLELKTPLIMTAKKCEDGSAGGDVFGWRELCEQVKEYKFDALALHTPITVPEQVALNYYTRGGVNPWGGVEAIASKLIAALVAKPVAHAPFDPIDRNKDDLYLAGQNKVVIPAIAPEVISSCYFHCVLKGLHKAPRIDFNKGIDVEDVDFLISPYGCIGKPHRCCFDKNIPVIAVRENTTIYNFVDNRIIYVDNYLEAAGVIMSMKLGMDINSVKRPLRRTNVR
jgi:hypothetical protein